MDEFDKIVASSNENDFRPIDGFWVVVILFLIANAIPLTVLLWRWAF